MSMSDEVAGATLQVSTQAAQVAGNVVNKTIDSIAKLLQALAAKRTASEANSTDLTDLKPGEVSIKEMRNAAIKNRENIVFSDNGFTADDRKILLRKAKDYGIPIAFQHPDKDNFYASVRSSDLPIFRQMCSELLKDKLEERPQELGNFKCKEWEIPYLTKELNRYDLPAQFGKTNNEEHFCLYDKHQEKTMLIARGLFINKCKAINENISCEKDAEGFLSIKDKLTGKEISFSSDKIPSREQLSQMVNEKFGFNDENKADLVCAKFGQEMLQGEEKQKFFSKDPRREFSKIETNIQLKDENLLATPYACWRLTPKSDGTPKIVFRDDEGRFAVLDPGTMNRAKMSEIIKADLNISDNQTVAALMDKATKVNDYYTKQAEANFVYDKNDIDISKLPIDDISCNIERSGKDSFTVSSTVTVDDHANQGSVVLSLSDKKNAIAEISNMLKEQGISEANAKQIAKECFARAENQSAEKVVHLEEIRGEKPYYGENSELQVDFKVGNKKETISVTNSEKAKKDLVETFGVSELAADAAMDNVERELTEREAAVLTKYGFKDLDSWSMNDAADVIGRIEGNGWKVPDYIDPATYKPGSIDFNAMSSAAPDMKMPELPKAPIPTAGRSR